MTILVLGHSGQLATHLRESLPEAVFWGRATLDLSEPSRVAAAIAGAHPSFIINAAAYTAVDEAESEPALAWRINAESVAAIASAATALDVPLVHVSTDYVFDGRKPGEYLEDDAPNPLNVYGATKLAGEIAVRTLCSKSWILRTSWLFSAHGTNFVRTILRLAKARDELAVVTDQRGRPTYAGHVAAVIAQLPSQRSGHNPLAFGTYNAVGGPIASWHEFAGEIVELAFEHGLLERRTPVRATSTSDYPTAARRPASSALRPSSALERTLNVPMDWREGLKSVLAELRS